MFQVSGFRTAVTASIVISAGLVVSSIFFFDNKVEAEVVGTSVTVVVCGNSIVETGEQCDDGNIISGDGCSSSCQDEAAVCGNGIVETGEQCDDGNTVSGDGCSVSCQTEPAPTPGAGGGAPPPVPTPTSVILKGKAYPFSTITILQDGRVVTNTIADLGANFSVQISDITAGVYTFGLWAEDNRGVRSITFSFTTSVISGTITTIGGIFLPPTISVDKTSVPKGENINFLGQTAPESEVSIHVNSFETIVKKTTAGEGGLWSYAFDTSPLEEGSHLGKSKATSPDGLLSSFSNAVSFFVGRGVPIDKPCADGDLNGDGKVNLIDFSIMLFHWQGKNDCTDQNNDGIVNIIDFSILLFWWTG